MTKSEEFISGIGRIMLAALFLASGFQEILTPTDTQANIASLGLPRPNLIFWIVVGIEIVGGLALALGIATRFAAVVLAVFSIAAAVGFHTRFADGGQTMNFLKNIAISGGLMQVFAFGSGGLGLGRKIIRPRSRIDARVALAAEGNASR